MTSSAGTSGEVATRSSAPSAPRLSRLAHLFAGGWIAAMLVFARVAPDRYVAAMQEDRVVEWWTVLLFALAGVVRLRAAIRERRLFDALVALFCLFVAGEEISWGQRLLGFHPPAPFLAHNTQQELNLHNFGGVFGRPKWILALALFGYGAALRVLVAFPAGWRVADRLGATPPPLPATIWFVAAVALLVWYPVEFTGEWVECLAGALFLATAGRSSRSFWTAMAAALAGAVALTAFSARGRGGDVVRVACARAETHALVRDLAGGAATARLRERRTVHKRVRTAGEDGYLDLSLAASFRSVSCAGIAARDASDRRRYAVDPWGTAYWIVTTRGAPDSQRIAVYSFGPNRRRDGEAERSDAARLDDIVADTVVRVR